jgi:hypothetical protein
MYLSFRDIYVMSSKEMVISLLARLPEDMTLEDIAYEIELLAGIKVAREQAMRGEGIPAQDARRLVDAWAAQ